MAPVSEIMDDRDKQIAHLIRERIKKAQDDLFRAGSSHSEELRTRERWMIAGLREALALVDPEPWK
jgi:hypothetical protein